MQSEPRSRRKGTTMATHTLTIEISEPVQALLDRWATFGNTDRKNALEIVLARWSKLDPDAALFRLLDDQKDSTV